MANKKSLREKIANYENLSNSKIDNMISRLPNDGNSYYFLKENHADRPSAENKIQLILYELRFMLYEKYGIDNTIIVALANHYHKEQIEVSKREKAKTIETMQSNLDEILSLGDDFNFDDE